MDLALGGLKADYGLAGGLVAPRQLAALLGDVETWDLAVSPQDAVLRFLDGGGLVPALHQPVAGQLGVVVVALLVEPPVFRDSQPGVPQALAAGVIVVGRRGGYLQHGIQRLSRARDGVCVAVPVCLEVGVEGDQQVEVDPFPRRRAGFSGQVELARDDGGFGAVQVVRELVDVAVLGEVVEAGRVVRLSLWQARAGSGGVGGSHVQPRRRR